MLNVPMAIFASSLIKAPLVSSEKSESSKDTISSEMEDRPRAATLRSRGVATKDPAPITRLMSTCIQYEIGELGNNLMKMLGIHEIILLKIATDKAIEQIKYKFSEV